MKKKLFAIAAICLMFFIGCRENEVMKPTTNQRTTE